jgi:hypothetical protein
MDGAVDAVLPQPASTNDVKQTTRIRVLLCVCSENVRSIPLANGPSRMRLLKIYTDVSFGEILKVP